MARRAKVIQNNKRKEVVGRYFAKRKELRDIIKNPDTSPEARMDAQRKMANMPRLAIQTRIRNRCRETGRTRGYLAKFDMCRLAFRKYASFGLIPGVTKASW